MLKRHSIIIIGVLIAIILAVSLAILRDVEVRVDNFRAFYTDYISKTLDAYNDDVVEHLGELYAVLSDDDVFTKRVLSGEGSYLDLDYRLVDYMLVANEALTLLDEGGGNLMADMMLTDVFNTAHQEDIYVYTVTQINGEYFYISAGPMLLKDDDMTTGVLLLAKKIDQQDLDDLLSLTSVFVDGKIMVKGDVLPKTEHQDRLNISHLLKNSAYYLNGKFNLKPYNDYIKKQEFSIIFTLAACVLVGGIILFLVIRRIFLKTNQLDHRLKNYVNHNYESKLDLSGYQGFELLNGIANSVQKIDDNRKFRIEKIDEDNSVIHDFLTVAYSANTGYSSAHQTAVPRYTEVLCRALNLKDYDNIIKAANIHDIGVMTVPRYIMNKKGVLTRSERDIVEHHAAAGQEYIAAMRSFKDVANLVGAHHENWDGSGYPNGLKGDQIPLGAQIIGLADVYDALISDRPHRPANTHEQASIYILENTGKKFSPRLVEAYRLSSDEFKSISQSLN